MTEISDKEAQHVLDLMGDDYAERVNGEQRQAKAEADARALWAVRVLDRADPTWRCVPHDTESGYLCMFTVLDRVMPELGLRVTECFRGDSQEAARIAAAAALVAADPSLDPDGVRT